MNKDVAKTAIQRARNEVAEERMADSVRKLKKLLIAEADAETVLENIRREIADLEESIEQGNG